MATKNISRIYSAEIVGIEAELIEVEVDISVGLHALNIVGLADRALNEAKERVNSALKNSGAKPPNRENRKIIVNLAPADVKKTGTHYDLAIALGYLLATRQIAKFDTEKKLFVGELALDGRLRGINGALNIAEMAALRGFEKLYLPGINALEAAAIPNIKVIPLENLTEAIEILTRGKSPVEIFYVEKDTSARTSLPINRKLPIGNNYEVDFANIAGQENAKRALMVAAAGGHNILISGPPGVGKSMLAKALSNILPRLSQQEAIEVTKIWSAAGMSPGIIMSKRPFRAPHQTISIPALIGGGGRPRPGEISLAHCGILFLDEFPEFSSAAIETLREPMESREINISRVRRVMVFPAKFILVAAMNPCPCGFYGDTDKECKCGAYEIIKYQRKISGPILDRIDMQIKVGRIKIDELRKSAGDRNSNELIRSKICATREIQARRIAMLRSSEENRVGYRGQKESGEDQISDSKKYKSENKENLIAFTNSEMTAREAEMAANLTQDGEKFLGKLDDAKISPRGYYRILKVARTIADLESAEQVSAEHIAEAFGYRVREEV